MHINSICLSSFAILATFGMLPVTDSKPSSSSSSSLDIPEMGFSPKAKFSQSSNSKPLRFCGAKLNKLVFLVAKKSVKIARRNRRPINQRRRGRSTEMSDEVVDFPRNSKFEEFVEDDEFLSANERMLMSSYNCQIQTEVFGIEESDECKAIVDFVSENKAVMMTKENFQSRSVRNTRSYYGYLQKINELCCLNDCTRDDEDEIIRLMVSNRNFRNMVIRKSEQNHALFTIETDSNEVN